MPAGAEHYDVFISYAHADDDAGVVRNLRHEIETRFSGGTGGGLRVFRDRDGIRAFDDWKVRCHRVLRDCRLFIVCFSESYLKSDACRWEWAEWCKLEAAQGRGGTDAICLWLIDGEAAGFMPERAEIAEWRREVCSMPRADGRAGRMEPLLHHLRERVAGQAGERTRRGNLRDSQVRFAGREAELARLGRLLQRQDGGLPVPVVITGVGGIGKTTLAVEAARRWAGCFSGGVWMLNGEGKGSLAAVLRGLAGDLNLELTDADKLDDISTARRVLEALQSGGPALLILDNVDQPMLFSGAAADLLPAMSGMHVLMTTRLAVQEFAGAGVAVVPLEIGFLSEAESVELILSYQPDGRFADDADRQTAGELARLLGGFTLAVETAAVYLGQNDSRVADPRYSVRMADYLGSCAHDLAGRPADGAMSQLREVAATIRPTLERLSPEPLTVLRIAAQLAPESISLPWVRSVAGHFHSILAEDAPPGERDAWAELVRLLTGRRLLSQTNGRPALAGLHRILQQVILVESPENRIRELALEVEGLVKKRVRVLETTTRWVEARWELEPLEALAAQWADAGHPGAEWLLSQSGVRWQQLGEWSLAEPPLRRSLSIAEETLGKNHPNYAAALGNLAALFLDTDRIDEAEGMLREALTIEESQSPPDDRKVALRLSSLALLLQRTGRMDEAEQMMRRALIMDEARVPAEPQAVAVRLNNLALLLHATGRLEEAARLSRRALDTDQLALGGQHPAVAVDLNNLAQIELTLFMRHGDERWIDEAEAAMRRAWEIDRLNFGENHPTVASDINNLAEVLITTRRLAEAEPLLRQALEIDETSFDQGSPRIASRQENLARLLVMRGRHTEAERLMREALKVRERSLGADHPDIAVMLSNLASVIAFQNRLHEAEALMRRALRIDEARLGPGHEFLALRLNDLAQILHRRGNLTEAEPLMRRALEIDLRVHGGDHSIVATDLGNLGCLLRDAGSTAHAEPLLRRSLEIHRRNLLPGETDIVAGIKNLGLLLCDLKRFHEAAELLQEALVFEENLFGTGHPVVEELRCRLDEVVSMMEPP